MDNEKQKKGGKLSIFTGIGDLLLGFFLLMLASGEKDSWEYYWSSSHRSDVDIASMIGWLFVIAGVASLIYGVIALSEANKAQTDEGEQIEKSAENIEWIEGEIIDKEWNPSQHQVEWIVLRQKNGHTVRLWHYIADDKSYKIGDCGLIRAQDRLITEFVPNEMVC